MVGTNKWTDEQIVLVFILYADGKSKKLIAEIINKAYPRRAASSAGVNYVLNTKKAYFRTLNTSSKAHEIKSRARAAAKLKSTIALQPPKTLQPPSMSPDVNTSAPAMREVSGGPMLATMSDPVPINVLNFPDFPRYPNLPDIPVGYTYPSDPSNWVSEEALQRVLNTPINFDDFVDLDVPGKTDFKQLESSGFGWRK
ncbi:hypothetical protein EG329_002057 [Mollisiaceae sp. DMI_Dod_QoI]|nr:hypothetical protein EG329_002057 [Helotiales sp. DMI_Dod_QoI]